MRVVPSIVTRLLYLPPVAMRAHQCTVSAAALQLDAFVVTALLSHQIADGQICRWQLERKQV
jgi:hypothetical protein